MYSQTLCRRSIVVLLAACGCGVAFAELAAASDSQCWPVRDVTALRAAFASSDGPVLQICLVKHDRCGKRRCFLAAAGLFRSARTPGLSLTYRGLPALSPAMLQSRRQLLIQQFRLCPIAAAIRAVTYRNQAGQAQMVGLLSSRPA